MYIIFGTVIILIIFLFGNSLITMIKTSMTNSKPNMLIGNIWFISLLILNIIIIIFIYVFYYYKSTLSGKEGNPGDRGFPGKPGEPCNITISNCNNYAEYNKI